MTLTRLLYHDRVIWRVACALALVLLVGGLGAGAGAAPPDRLERFRQLAASRLGLALLESETPLDAYAEIYALLDDEIVESLAAGSVFASIPFLQERLDGFAGAWGGAVLRVQRVGPLVVGTFQLNDRGGGNTVRVYGQMAGEPGLLAVLHREGRPTLYPVAPGAGAPQFLVTWEGVPAAWGTRPLRLEIVRQQGEGVTITWSSADALGEDLQARSWSVRGTEVRVRYPLRYPGWVPGCEGQTEQEDVFRIAAPTGTLVRERRVEHQGWHRAFRAEVARLLAAVEARDAAAIALAVPDPALRRRLPPGLAVEPACDARETVGGDAVVSVAAIDGQGQPWTLTFRRAGPRWRLTAATPVLQ